MLFFTLVKGLTRKIASEMTYNVSSGTLNPIILYHIKCKTVTLFLLIYCSTSGLEKNINQIFFNKLSTFLHFQPFSEIYCTVPL